MTKNKGLRLANADNGERMCRQDKSKENNQEKMLQGEKTVIRQWQQCEEEETMLDDGKFEGSYGVEHVLKPDVL